MIPTAGATPAQTCQFKRFSVRTFELASASGIWPASRFQMAGNQSDWLESRLPAKVRDPAFNGCSTTGRPVLNVWDSLVARAKSYSSRAFLNEDPRVERSGCASLIILWGQCLQSSFRQLRGDHQRDLATQSSKRSFSNAPWNTSRLDA